MIGSQDDKLGCGVWDLDGNQIHNFCDDGSKIRANDLAISPDGQRLVIVSETSIAVFDFESYEKISQWRAEEAKLTSVTISKDSQHMLISMNPDKIKLMEIDTGEVIRDYEGHSQKHFIIRSAFGGADENFIISGSEGKLHTKDETLLPMLISANRLKDPHMALKRSPRRSPRRTYWLRQQRSLASHRPHSIRVCRRRPQSQDMEAGQCNQ